MPLLYKHDANFFIFIIQVLLNVYTFVHAIRCHSYIPMCRSYPGERVSSRS